MFVYNPMDSGPHGISRTIDYYGISFRHGGRPGHCLDARGSSVQTCRCHCCCHESVCSWTSVPGSFFSWNILPACDIRADVSPEVISNLLGTLPTYTQLKPFLVSSIDDHCQHDPAEDLSPSIYTKDRGHRPTGSIKQSITAPFPCSAGILPSGQGLSSGLKGTM